jgi:hypothetical protein
VISFLSFRVDTITFVCVIVGTQYFVGGGMLLEFCNIHLAIVNRRRELFLVTVVDGMMSSFSSTV